MNLCKIENCGKSHCSKGYCTKHYQRFKLYGDPLIKRKAKQKEKCSVVDCNNKISCQGYCVLHYTKIIRNGRTTCKLCNQPSIGKGYCSLHYQRLKRNNDVEKVLLNISPPKTCQIEGCNKPYSANGMCQAHYMKKYNEERRKLVISHYTNGTMKCQCCGESIYEFLDMDHTNDNGAEHRRQGVSSGNELIDWLIRNNFPHGFRVLCSNCNVGRYRNSGICPHKKNI